MRGAILGILAGGALAIGCGQSQPPKVEYPNPARVPGPPVVSQPVRPVPAPPNDPEGRQDGAAASGGAQCGRERWDVKAASDPQAARINTVPKDTTIAAINQLQSTNNGNPDQPRQPGYEMQVWRVTGTLVEARGESDSDVHLVLADGQGNHLGVESPFAPACTQPPFTPSVSVLEPQIEQARNAFVQEFGLPGKYPQPPLMIGRQVTVTGVGFADFGHHQVGAARNYLELHPLLSIQDP